MYDSSLVEDPVDFGIKDHLSRSQVGDSPLLGIPRSRAKITRPDPWHEGGSAGSPTLSGGARTHVADLPASSFPDITPVWID